MLPDPICFVHLSVFFPVVGVDVAAPISPAPPKLDAAPLRRRMLGVLFDVTPEKSPAAAVYLRKGEDEHAQTYTHMHAKYEEIR